MRSFYDLASSRAPYPNQLQVFDKTIRALGLVDQVPVGYVWPNVRAEIVEGARIVLVVAAGAVGKSAAAAALAGSLRWPLVDAAKAQVGSYSLSGLLHDALGFESNYIAEVASGRAGIIVDALDEAHLRAGTTNFQAFVDNIRKLAGTGHRNITVVAFSRPDTAEIVKVFLEEAKTAYSLLVIDFFEYEQACDYLKSRLAQLEKDRLEKGYPDRNYGVAVKHASGYAQLRDQRMREIAGALLAQQITDIDSAWPHVAEFLGYAPVLSVLAEVLAVSNPYAELSRPLSLGVEARNILLRIIDDLLVREQKKFQEQVCGKLLSQLPAMDEWPRRETAYSLEEQGIRLVAKYLNLDIVEPPPALLPISLRLQYDRDADQFTADHPFLAGSDAVNVVFGDYILAKAAVDQGCRIAIESDPSRILRPVGPFFYQFVHQFAPRVDFDSDEEKSAQVEENLVSRLVDSCSQSQISPRASLFAYYQSGDDAECILLDNLKSNGKGHFKFKVADPTGILIFPSKLTRGIIVTDGGVVLGQAKERFIFGPSVTLICAELDIEAEYLSVDSMGSDGSHQPCIISAGSIRVVGRLTVDAPHADALTVFGETGWPALRPYIKQASGNASFDTQAGYVDLRAVLKAFRQTLHSRWPTVYGDLMDQRIVKNNSRRKKYFAKLQALQIVSYDNRHYYLDTSKLAQFGINWQSMFDGAPTDSVLSFLVKLSAD